MQYVHIVISSTESSGQLFFLSDVLTPKIRGLFFEVFFPCLFFLPPSPPAYLPGELFYKQ